MAENKIVSLVLIKPDKVEQEEYITGFFYKTGLEIIKKETFSLTSEQAKSFYKNDEEWLKKLGKKISSSCFQERIDPFSKFNIERDNYLELGRLGKKWNEAYLNLGPVVALLIGPNGSRVDRFFEEIEEAVGFLREVLCSDTYEKANTEGRAYYNGIHLARTQEEFAHQVQILWPENK